MKGYKISNSHFRLGSKTHIRDFIYAKRLFQNSFFAHRFAFMIAQYVNVIYKDQKLHKNKSLTLLGYGEYSQMTLNRAEKILKKEGIKDINHDMVADAEELRLIKGEELGDYIIIIVPISTTFSTSVKVANLLGELIAKSGKDSQILEPFLNLILISHNDIANLEYVKALNNYLASNESSDDERYQPYKQFNWQNVDQEGKKVLVKINSRESFTRLQKYFISIASEWYLMENCQLCFPKEDLLLESPLLNTDKVSVSPDLLLELPDSFKNDSYSAVPGVIINEQATYNSHTEHQGRHYLHYIKPYEFFAKYEELINEWAKKRHEELEKWPNLFKSRVLIIAPSYQANTYFVELVNRLVFYESATIINYEIMGDMVENYYRFFGEMIQSADFVFYVDDFIQSGKTFHQVNNFVKLCKRYSPNAHPNQGCDGVFTLINKTDNFAYDDILNHLKSSDIPARKRYYAFYDLKLSAVSLENCPLCHQQKRYAQLAESSMLDTIRHYFLTKKIKLDVKAVKEGKKDKTDWFKFHPLVNESAELPWYNKSGAGFEMWEDYRDEIFPEKKYLMLILQHVLNHLLSTDKELRQRLEEITEISFDKKDDYLNLIEQFFQSVNEKVKESGSIKQITKDLTSASKIVFEEQCAQMVIKVFTMYPFETAKLVKKAVFTKVIVEMEKLTKNILGKDNLKFKDFRYFKFLLKRATLMGSNYLIREETLSKLRLIYRKYTLEKKNIIEANRKKKISQLDSKIEEHSLLVKNLKETLDEAIREADSLLLPLNKKKRIVKNQMIPFESSSTHKKYYESIDELQLVLWELNRQICFLEQARDNIAYKEASLSEFSYFYVALIKELTFSNDPKVLILEQNIRKLSAELDAKEDEDFMFLLRLIQFENTSIIHQGLRLIADEYLNVKGAENENKNGALTFASRCSSVVIQKRLANAFEVSLEDYRLSSFRSFLDIKKFNDWSKTDEYRIYTHALYLISVFQNEQNNPVMLDLDDKNKAIIQNIYRIVAYEKTGFFAEDDTDFWEGYRDKIDAGGFFAVRFRGYKNATARPKDIFIAQATSKHVDNSGPSLISTEIDNESISYFLINGVASRSVPLTGRKDSLMEVPNDKDYNTKPRTILELKLFEVQGNNHWKSSRGSVFSIVSALEGDLSNLVLDDAHQEIKFAFTENLAIKGKPTQMLFFRVADIFEEDGNIKNVGHGVIGLFNDEASFVPWRIRLLLLIRPYLLHFMKSHFDTDSLTALIREKLKLKEAEKLKHGYQYYLSALYSMASKETAFLTSKEREKYSKLYYDLVKSGPELMKVFSEVEILRSKSTDIPEDFWKEKSMFLKSLTANDLLDKFEDIARMIYGTKEMGNSKLSGIVDFDNNLEFVRNNSEIGNNKICFPEALIDIIFAEAVINAKKNRPDKGVKLYISVSAEFEGLRVKISNNFQQAYPEKLWLRINKNSLRYNTNGLGLIKRITGLISGEFAEVGKAQDETDGEQLFQVSFLLRNYDEKNLLYRK